MSFDEQIRKRAEELAAIANEKAATDRAVHEQNERDLAAYQLQLAERGQRLAKLCMQYLAWLRRNKVPDMVVYGWPRKKKGWYIGTHRTFTHTETWDRELAQQRRLTIQRDEGIYIDKQGRLYDRKAGEYTAEVLDENVLLEVISSHVSKLGKQWP